MVANDHRVCLGGSTPPFRASPKTPNIGSWTSKNFVEISGLNFGQRRSARTERLSMWGPFPTRMWWDWLVYDGMPSATRNFLERKFLDFKELN
jgi:hypothetical protein